MQAGYPSTFPPAVACAKCVDSTRRAIPAGVALDTGGGIAPRSEYRRRGIPQTGKGRKRCGNVGAPRPVCTLNGDDESAMNRPNVGAISPFCSIKNNYYKAFTVAHKHARHSLIRRFGAACNTLPDRCRAYRRGYMQHPANERRRSGILRRS